MGSPAHEMGFLKSGPKDPFTDCLELFRFMCPTYLQNVTYLQNQHLGNGAKESPSLTFLNLFCDTYFEKAQKTKVLFPNL